MIVLGATNRPDVLDPALLRPGRFDRRVFVQPPDAKGREQILKVHTRSVPLADDVDLARIAQTTPGMVGADLANLVNEAALLAARRGHDKVHRSDFTDALEKIILGAERKVLISEADRRRTAYHEGGHAIVGMLTPGADPVRKVSIIPRGQALGVTLSTPEDDRFNYTEDELRAKIKVSCGGRIAEEIVYDEPTTGAESDIQQVTGIARGMVERWGMSSKVGFLAVAPREGAGALLPGADPVSEATKELIDQEVRQIVDNELDQVRQLLSDNRERLDSLVEALMRARDARRARRLRGGGNLARAQSRPRPDAGDHRRSPRGGRGGRRPDDRGRGRARRRARGRASTRRPRGCRPGCGCAEKVFERVDPDLRWHAHADEGVWADGGLVAELAGAASSILAAERVALNFLGRLSGVATLTARYVGAVEGTGVADPRHPQDHPGPARAREGGGAQRRRGQPSRRPPRRDPRQGEPRDAGRGRRDRRAPGAWRGARATACRSRSSARRSTTWRARSTRACRGCCWTTCRPTSCAPRSS